MSAQCGQQCPKDLSLVCQVTTTGTSEALNQSELWEKMSWCRCSGAREEALQEGLRDLGRLPTKQEPAEHRLSDEAPYKGLC